MNPWRTGDVERDAAWIADALMHAENGLTIEQDHRLQGILTLDIPGLAREKRTAHSEGYEQGQAVIWGELVCSACGHNSGAEIAQMFASEAAALESSPAKRPDA